MYFYAFFLLLLLNKKSSHTATYQNKQSPKRSCCAQGLFVTEFMSGHVVSPKYPNPSEHSPFHSSPLIFLHFLLSLAYCSSFTLVFSFVPFSSKLIFMSSWLQCFPCTRCTHRRDSLKLSVPKVDTWNNLLGNVHVLCTFVYEMWFPFICTTS